MTKTDITEQCNNPDDICDNTTVRSIDNFASIYDLEDIWHGANSDELQDLTKLPATLPMRHHERWHAVGAR
eukprot:4434078-Pyramimonas_sp.AAC.1